MDITIILGIVLTTIIFLYICTLAYSLWRLNQQVGQADQWNNFRNHLFTRAQEDQERAKRVTTSIRNQYGGLGVPYPADRDKAVGRLRRIAENAEALLSDRENRAAISPDKKPFSWRTFLIRSLWVEFQNRQDWWKATLKLQSRLKTNQSEFLAVEKLLNELDAKGHRTKTDFETLQNQTHRLMRAFEDERRTDAQFQDQIEQLQQLQLQITQTIKQNLTGFELAPKQVAAAASKLQPCQTEWGRLNEILENSKKVYADAP